MVDLRQPWADDPIVDALEELRVVDRLLADVEVVARTSELDVGALAAASRLAFPTPWPSNADVEARQDEHDALMAEAMRHLQGAIERTGGHLWNGGVQANGTAWALNSSVGLRGAARDYFEALVAHDPARLSSVTPLAPLERAGRRWTTLTWIGAFLGLVVALVATVVVFEVPPLALALIPPVAALQWIQRRRARRARATALALTPPAERDPGVRTESR